MSFKEKNKARLEIIELAKSQYRLGQEFDFKRGDKVFCNGYPGIVQATFSSRQVEVSLDSGFVCVVRTFPTMFPHPLAGNVYEDTVEALEKMEKGTKSPQEQARERYTSPEAMEAHLAAAPFKLERYERAVHGANVASNPRGKFDLCREDIHPSIIRVCQSTMLELEDNVENVTTSIKKLRLEGMAGDEIRNIILLYFSEEDLMLGLHLT